MKEKELNKNREHLLKLLLDKSALKQDVADDCEKVFMSFKKAICKELGVIGHIQSPTFSIVNEYLSSSGKTIFHFDFYRIKNEIEALDFGIEEYFDSGNICLLEWAEKVESLLPNNCFKIKISLTDDLGRNIEF